MKKAKVSALLTVPETAREIGVSEATVWRMLRAGALASVQRSGRRLVRRSAVERRARAAPRGQLRAFTPTHPLWLLVGAFRGGSGPGSSDKYGALFGDD